MKIVLIRHGRPLGATNPLVNSAGFAHWVRTFNKSGIVRSSVPPKRVTSACDGALLVSSQLRRARQSAALCAGREPDSELRDLNEMEIPRYRLPIRMPAYFWVVINRTLWMAGARCNSESYRDARRRADRVATKLHDLSATHDRIAVVGHGMMNLHVGRALIARGWSGRVRPFRYWDAVVYEFE
jgi:broad specificity phosphatase PhoE